MKKTYKRLTYIVAINYIVDSAFAIVEIKPIYEKNKPPLRVVLS